MKNNVFLRILFNTALGVILILVWSHFVDFRQIIGRLKTTDPQIALLFFFFFIVSGVLRGLRLKVLLNQHSLSWKDASMLTFLGQFLSFLIPVRAGEIAKSVYLTSRFDVPLAKSVVWIFIDRFLDFLIVLLFIVLLVPLVVTNLPDQFVPITSLILLGFVAFFALAVISESFLKKIIQFLSNYIPVKSISKRFVSFTYSIIEGFEVLRRHPGELALLLFLSAAAEISDGIIWLAAFLALGVNLGIVTSVLGNALAALTFLIPSAPGYVGSAEAATLAVFSGALKFNPNLVSAATVLFHLLTLVALFILGLGSLYFLKFNLSAVWKRIRGEK